MHMHVDEDVAYQAIQIKRKTNIKLADAVIAATAMVKNLKLATRNIDDFKGVKELAVINPFI